MKKYLYIIFIFSILVISGCEDFLTQEPKSVITQENAYNTPEDWQQTLTGAYAVLQKVFLEKYPIVLANFGTDEVIPFDLGWAAYAELHYYTFSPSHAFLNDHYTYAYEGIKRCNTVLDMPADVVDNATYNLMIAQARFLRAIYYFDLVRMYGSVSLWLSSSVDRDNIMIPRSSVDEVYTVITDDLKAALSLPATWADPKDKGRATSYAAQAFLARVYLQWGKPNEALGYCRMLDGKFHLYDNLKDIFDYRNKNQEYENIFEIQHKHSGAWGLEGSLQHSYWGPRGVGGPTAFGGWGGFGPSQYLYDSYEITDKRKQDFFFAEFNGVPQSPPSCAKFFDPVYGNVIEDDQLNFILIRYADVLLMRAEALNNINDQTDEKYDALNLVRNRARLSSITKADNLTNQQFADLLLMERMHELCCEHMRRWDLLRFGKLEEAVQAAYGISITLPKHFLYPIPQGAVDANEAITENNPGY
jgi:hypothetical protein